MVNGGEERSARLLAWLAWRAGFVPPLAKPKELSERARDFAHESRKHEVEGKASAENC